MEPGEELEYRAAVRDAVYRHPETYRMLKAYGFEDPEPEGTTLNEFVDLSVFDGPLDQVVALGRFLEVTEPAEIPASVHFAEAGWAEGQFRVFLSHHSNDREFAEGLKRELGYGVDVFVAHEDIEPSKKWLRVIEASLATADALVAAVGTEFRSSVWCDQEAGWALARSIPIVPIMLEGVPPHGFLGQQRNSPGTAGGASSRKSETRRVVSRLSGLGSATSAS